MKHLERILRAKFQIETCFCLRGHILTQWTHLKGRENLSQNDFEVKFGEVEDRCGGQNSATKFS